MPSRSTRNSVTGTLRRQQRRSADVRELADSGMFEDEVIDRLRERHPQYHETAYLFILSALQYVLEKLPEPRHITGAELAEGARKLALGNAALMAGFDEIFDRRCRVFLVSTRRNLKGLSRFSTTR